MCDRAMLYEYKGDRCAHCGKTVREHFRRFRTIARSFEFNHINPSTKHPDYDNLIRRKLSAEQLDEVDKCALLCRECHGVLHAQNLKGEAVFTLRAGGREAEQRVRGQFIIDHQDGKGTFFSDDLLLVWPYAVCLGHQQPRVAFARELYDGELVKLILGTREHDTLRVFAGDGHLDVLVRRLDPDHFEFQCMLRFPLIRMEEETAPVPFWIRNGALVAADGEVIREGVIEGWGTYEDITEGRQPTPPPGE
jgi:hypothetical protein